MADKKLYLLSVRWSEYEEVIDDVWTVWLLPTEERLLWRSLNEANKKGVIHDFYLVEAVQDSLSSLMTDLKKTDLGPFVNPKSWNPGPRKS